MAPNRVENQKDLYNVGMPIRRSVLGILFMAFLTLSTIRYATHVNHERQKEADRQRKQEEEQRRDGGKRDHSSAADAAVILAAN